MEIQAMMGETKVCILSILSGSPKDGAETMVVYYNYTTGVIGVEYGDAETVLANFCVCE